jgi:photosystem II stability/assembly factor-like uncharacterized protein
MGEYFTGNNGNLFAQPDGPNTRPVPLGCHDLGDISQPEGDISQRYCPDPAGPGRWRRALTTKGMPERGTASLTTYLSKVADWLEEQRGPMSLYVHMSEEGRKDAFGNYDEGLVMRDTQITSRGRSGVVTREGAEAAEKTVELSFDRYQLYHKPSLMAIATVETAGFTAVTFCNEEMLESDLGPARKAHTIGFAAAQAATGAAAKVYRTLDGGATWVACSTSPFGINEHIAAIAGFDVDRGVTRILALCGTTKALTGVQIAYSDDLGETWHLLDAGTDGDYALGTESLVALDMYHLWIATDGGDILFSEDGGLNWTAQTVASNNKKLYAIKFIDELHGLAAGEDNGIFYTRDGGAHWTVVLGDVSKDADDVIACELINQNRMWVGYSDGELWFTMDGGSTWAQRALIAPAGASELGAITDIRFLDDHCGFLTLNWTKDLEPYTDETYGTIYRTINGGYNWELWSSAAFDATTGLQSIYPRGYDKAVAVGGLIDSLGAMYALAV